MITLKYDYGEFMQKMASNIVSSLRLTSRVKNSQLFEVRRLPDKFLRIFRSKSLPQQKGYSQPGSFATFGANKSREKKLGAKCHQYYYSLEKNDTEQPPAVRMRNALYFIAQ